MKVIILDSSGNQVEFPNVDGAVVEEVVCNSGYEVVALVKHLLGIYEAGVKSGAVDICIVQV